MRGVQRLRSLVQRSPGIPSELIHPTPEDIHYLSSLYDASVPLPAEAELELTLDNPQLTELRRAYAELDLPALDSSRWHRGAVGSFLDLQWFRGESLFVWHYRELPRISRLKYFVYAEYVRSRDQLGLLERLGEDGAFGCWTFEFPGWPRVSRDLLQSVNEIAFLERELGLSRRDQLRVLDIGAGYGRLAHRMAAALPNLVDYCCVDTIPEATFLSDWYLRHRGCTPPCRVARLDRIDADLEDSRFDLAVNIHSFSECPLSAIEWWLGLLRRLEVPALLVVPNEPAALLSTESDESRQDFSGRIRSAGYELVSRRPVIEDDAMRELIPLYDEFHLFRRAAV
jgi:SAM-dependent methyltransferase